MYEWQKLNNKLVVSKRAPTTHIITCNKRIRPTVGADYPLSKKNPDYESGPSRVTLSRSEGSVALGAEMLRCGSA